MSADFSESTTNSHPLVDQMHLAFLWQEKSYDLKLHEINMRILRASIDGAYEISEFVIDSPLRCSLYNDNQKLSCELNLRIETFDSTDKKAIFSLVPDDDGSRAQLWFFINQTENRLKSVVRNKFETTKLAKIPGRGLYTEEARILRLNFLREETGAKLNDVQHTLLKADELTGNIENFFGAVQIPVGVVGPLLINGGSFTELLYAPFATSEGALVASATRGAAALTRSGGVRTRVLNQRMMRVPLFVLSDMNGAFLFASWVRDHFSEIKEKVSEVSRHAQLTELDTTLLGNMVHVSFIYETGDAAGQNMTTACTWNACQWIMQQMKHFETIKFDNFVIDGNMSGDKKVNFSSFVKGRGIRVTAECVIGRKELEEVLKVTPEQFCRIHTTNVVGGIQTGMVGYNVNIANVIAAMFTATGQDIASVHECSIGHFHVEAVEDGVYVSLLLPSLIIGTVGGGTHLPQQKELLEMMGCVGVGKVGRLAEIIASFCLALEISTGAAIASGQFVSAHERLGRNRPVTFFTHSDLNIEFFTKVLKSHFKNEDITVSEVVPVTSFKGGSSIISELTANKVRKMIGLFPFKILYCGGNTPQGELDLMVKVKPLAAEVELLSNSLAVQCGGGLATTFPTFKNQTGSAMCHEREIAIANFKEPAFTEIMPSTYMTYQNPKREAYIVVMELLKDLELMNSADHIEEWAPSHIEVALTAAARFHGVFYEKYGPLLKAPWIGTVHTASSMVEMMPLWYELSNHMFKEFSDWFEKDDRQIHRDIIASIPQWWSEIEKMPRTLIHNDFSPRNVCFKGENGCLKLVAYDWELATIHIPQHDLAELLVFTLTPDVSPETVIGYVDHYRKSLEKEIQKTIDPEQFRHGYRLALWDLSVNRLAMYMMAHTFRDYAFMYRIVKTTQRLLLIEKQAAEN